MVKHITLWGDFYDAAEKASREVKGELTVQVEWRSEDQYVDEPWRGWAYAHIQVESGGQPKEIWTLFRRMLSLRARKAIPPSSE